MTKLRLWPQVTSQTTWMTIIGQDFSKLYTNEWCNGASANGSADSGMLPNAAEYCGWIKTLARNHKIFSVNRTIIWPIITSVISMLFTVHEANNIHPVSFPRGSIQSSSFSWGPISHCQINLSLILFSSY